MLVVRTPSLGTNPLQQFHEQLPQRLEPPRPTYAPPLTPWEPAPEPAAAPEPPDPEPSPQPPPPGFEPTPFAYRSRPAALTKFERERLKLDKWVTPKGTLPPQPRKSRSLRDNTALTQAEAELPPPVKNGNIMMVDKIGDKEVAFYEDELYGEFAFRDTILDQLDCYWVYLARMRKHDRDAYDLYSKLGATIVPPVTFFLHDGMRISKNKDKKEWKVPNMTPWWKANRPAFGCVSYGITPRIEEQELHPPPREDRKTLWIPKFLYFVKYAQPPSTIQPMTGGDVYGMTIWWDRPQDTGKHGRKWGTPESFAIYISQDGSERRVLKMQRSWVEHVEGKRRRSKRGRGRKGEGASFHRHGWVLPGCYKEWAKVEHTTVQNLLLTLFMEAAITYEHAAYSMVRVEVNNPKHNLTATFGVDIKRMGYFFKDRDITVTGSGTRQRVFHIVRPHERHTKHGAVNVPFHFRGLREFSWAGYQVGITVPGHDHFMLSEYDVGAVDDEYLKDLPKSEKLNEKQIAEYLHQRMQSGLGAFLK